jgi:uncharacterized repeat protein (TIGR02059 family)
MRNTFVLLFLFISLSLSGATYYVATNGSDSNSGTITSPWLTWQKGFNALSAGDVLYIRGGTYTGLLGSYSGTYFGVRVIGKKGTSSNPITVSAYQGEVPILNCSGLTQYSGSHYGMVLENCSYWNITGITVKSVHEYSSGGSYPYTGSGLELSVCTYMKLIQCNVTDCMNGFSLNGKVDYIYYTNCDSYKNYDRYDGGGLCNGYNGNISAGSHVFYEGCRAWSNSDDGYDNMAGGGYITYTNCWAFRNGYDNPTQGDGDGFKLGYTDKGDEAGVQRTLINCVSSNNYLMGFDESMDVSTSMDMSLFNCIAYNNSNDYGFRFSQSAGSGVTTLRNNVSYLNRVNYEGRSRNITDHNTWNSGAPAVTSSDFSSTDYTELGGSRKSDGSLPDINYLHLVSGSDLIDAGVSVGIAYSGNGPDLGAFEFQDGSSTVLKPVYVSSVIEDATPTLLDLTYDLTLNTSIIPATSSYNVLVNSVSRPVNSVAISGNKVRLTLSSAVKNGDVISVTYTTPSSNPLQSLSGGLADDLSNRAVTNNVKAVIPVYVSSAVANATPSVVEMTYNMTLASITPSTATFTVMVNGASRAVSSVSISGTKVLLTLASPIVYGNSVTVAYTKPTSNPLQATGGGLAVNLSAQTVTNNVLAVIPVYSAAAVANATPSVIEMTYSITLASVIPAASAFAVKVNSVARTVNTVAISGTRVMLTLASPIVFGNTVTVAYTKPSSNPLQATAGGQAATITAQTVTNNVLALIPVYSSSAVANATPSQVEMTYSLTLANVIPATTAFSVNVNSVARTVNSVAVSGTKVMLTLANPIVYGNKVTVAYTKPSTNPLQTTAGAQAVSISAQAVTNNVLSVIPVYTSSVVANATPSVVEMTYSLNLSSILPAASAFSVMVNSVARTVNTVAISGTKVMLTLASPVVSGNTVTVAYTKPSSNPLQSTSGAQAETITAQSVTNNVQAVAPVYVSSAVANATPSIIEMTYTLALANIVPAATAFSVKVNSVARAVTAVTISGTKVLLTLSSPMRSGNSVTVAYTKPATNPLQTSGGGQAAAITAQSVTNNITNAAPVAAITSPANNSSFTTSADIPIAASASDTDGSISLVEFYNGATLLGSTAVSPYKYTWTNVAAGSYTLTVVATDNLNTKTASAPISILVSDVPPVSNEAPEIAISNPTKGIKYESPASIEIKADASDPDGTIKKVVLYSGSDKLIELTSAPYTYVWKDVSKGTYSITAVATDNLNAVTTSTPVEFTVVDAPIYDGNSDLINLYPNPNSGHFWIEFVKPLQSETCRVLITDLAGKKVYLEPVLNQNTLMEFNLTYLKSGMYIMMVLDKEILITKKFIIK